jgi:hypothetical protein
MHKFTVKTVFRASLAFFSEGMRVYAPFSNSSEENHGPDSVNDERPKSVRVGRPSFLSLHHTIHHTLESYSLHSRP